MPAYGKPSGGWKEYLAAAKRQVDQKYGNRNTKLDGIRTRRLRERKPNIPKGWADYADPVTLPKVDDLIRRAQAIIAAQLPRPKITPTNPGSTKSQANSTLREKWLSVYYQETFSRDDVWGQITDAFAADGMTVWKTLPRLHRFHPEQEDGEDDEHYNQRVDTARKSHFPLFTEHIESKTYKPLAWDDDGLSEVLETTHREDVSTLLDAYKLTYRDGVLVKRVGAVGEPSEPPAKVRWDEYWNRDRFVYLIDDEIVKEGKHHLGRPPYFMAKFSTTSIKSPEHETEAIAEAILDLQDQLEDALTAKKNWAKIGAFPTAKLVPMNEDAIPQTDNQTVIEYRPSDTIQPPYGFDFQWVAPPPVGKDLNDQLQIFGQMLDDVSLAPILYGKLNGDISGPVALSGIAIAKAIFGPGMQNLRQVLNEHAAYVQFVIEKVVKAPVPLYHEGDGDWLELGPDDIDGYYRVDHALEPVIPMEKQQQIIMLSDGQSRGAISMRMLREEGYGLEAPEEMDEEVLVEQLANRPEYGNALMKEFLRRVGQDPTTQQPSAPEALPVGPPQTIQLPGVQQPMMPGIDPTMAALPVAPNGIP